MLTCPLCHHKDCTAFAKDKKRAYYQCQQCALVFAEPASWPSPSDEKAEYDQHENDVSDAGYNRFLARIVQPVLNQLPVTNNARLLDFGCGPGPALAAQFEQLGHQVALYDVFYFPDDNVLNKRYHAITLTEVLEHLHQPMNVLAKLWALLEAGGVLAIMTQRVIDQEAFARWGYKNDPTHVCFYHEKTFYWLADQLGAQSLIWEGRDMTLLVKGTNKPS